MPQTLTIDAFWHKYCEAHPTTGAPPPLTAFGDSPEQQTTLCNLVLAGTKRATASLARYYGPNGDPLPKPGDRFIILDGTGVPRGIIETTEIHQAPFTTADAQFAADEGEGDGSLEYWINEHRRFFSNQLAEEGLVFAETDQIIFERFKLIWP